MKVVYRRRAHNDLESIHDYIARDNPTAARSVIARIMKSIGRLEGFPLSGRPGPKAGTRELSVPGLPYLAIYKVVDERDREFVEIVAVYHTARKR
jgi:addiction module RelE/StbE family toxin